MKARMICNISKRFIHWYFWLPNQNIVSKVVYILCMSCCCRRRLWLWMLYLNIKFDINYAIIPDQNYVFKQRTRPIKNTTTATSLYLPFPILSNKLTLVSWIRNKQQAEAIFILSGTCTKKSRFKGRSPIQHVIFVKAHIEIYVLVVLDTQWKLGKHRLIRSHERWEQSRIHT